MQPPGLKLYPSNRLLGKLLSFNYSMNNPADLSIWIWASASVLLFPLA